MTRLIPAALGLAFAAGLVLATPSQAEAPYELNISSLAPDPSPWRDALKQLEKAIESESGGRIDVKVRPPVMGELEMVRETKKGEKLQAAGVSTGALAEGGDVPELQLVELPYLFDNYSEVDHVLDHVVRDDMANYLKRRGFYLVMWSENGWRSMATKAKPVRTPADLTGLKMRSQESDVHMAMWKAFGANAVQKPMTETLTAIQSGVVDGLDNSPIFLQAGGFAESLKYLTVTEHIFQPAAVVVSRKWVDALPADLQAVVLKDREGLQNTARAAIRAETMMLMSGFEAYDMEVVTLTPAEKGQWQERGRSIHDSFAATIPDGAKILAKIRASLAEQRK